LVAGCKFVGPSEQDAQIGNSISMSQISRLPAISRSVTELMKKLVRARREKVSTSGKSMDIFNCGFDRAFRDKPYGRNETLYFGCHDYNAFK